MRLRPLLSAGIFAALITVSSQLYIPLGPVPHTLQVFFVMLAGVVLGARWGFMSVAVWVMLGAFGLPVFAQGKAGLAVLVGPTGGFIVGFMACAFVVGWLTERWGAGLGAVAGWMLIGLAVLYVAGMAGFLASFNYFLHKPMTLDRALTLAVVPFLSIDLVKTALAAYIGVRVRRALIGAGYIQGSN